MHLVLIVVLASLLSAAMSQRSMEILLYKDINQGVRAHHAWLERGKCFHLDKFNDLTSSVDTRRQCIQLFEHRGCTGRDLKIAPGVGCNDNLGDCDFNDVATSFKKC
jgi:hypothetical protein